MRIVWASDKIMSGWSAYTKVSKEMCKRTLTLGHQVAHIPMNKANNIGQFVWENVVIYKSGFHPFAEDVMLDSYVDWNADMLIALKESWVFSNVHKLAINFVPYCPIDHEDVSSLITSRMHTAFKVLTPSRFGQRELKQAGIASTYMPHGVATNVFHPLPDKNECKKMFYIPEDDFTVTIIALNQARKMIPRMLRGYKRFRELNPDVKSHLFLWTDVHPASTPQAVGMGVSDVGVSLLPEIMRLGLGDPVMWTEMAPVRKLGGLPDRNELTRAKGQENRAAWDMVTMYNASDVLFGCTGGEGFALTYVEAQACGIPVAGTEYASGPEQIGAGLTVPYNDYIVFSTPGVRYALPSIDAMADALTKIYNTNREKLAEKARKFALRYEWANIIENYWKPFLQECEKELRPKIVKGGGVESWA